MKYITLMAVCAAFCFASCNNEKMEHEKRHAAMLARMDSLRQDLLQTDKDFSQLSGQKGRNAAFVTYADDNATVLRPNSMPVSGKDTIMSRLNRHPDSAVVLTWQPLRAVVARSGELGFTYGTYSFERQGSEKSQGTYCTVWKKDKDNKWKFVMDTGNQGLSLADKTEKENRDKEKGETGKEKKHTKKS